VKLDRSLVQGIDSDPVRQALVTGMVHFAEAVECTLVAEGIETAAERSTLLALGVPFGQGFLLAPPRRVDAYGGTGAVTVVGAIAASRALVPEAFGRRLVPSIPASSMTKRTVSGSTIGS
jgi:predicted signal transduction protein with EAL and GGDEF domain